MFTLSLVLPSPLKSAPKAKPCYNVDSNVSFQTRQTHFKAKSVVLFQSSRSVPWTHKCSGGLRFKVRRSDICFPHLFAKSMQTKGEKRSTYRDLWFVREYWLSRALERRLKRRNKTVIYSSSWTFLSSRRTLPLFEAFHLNYSKILEVSRGIYKCRGKKKTKPWPQTHSVAAAKVAFNPGRGRRC